MERIVDRQIFQQDAEVVAGFVLGKVLVRRLPSGEEIRGRISEVEIYRQDDTACHAYKGKTARNAPLFENGGTIYVYLCYGIFNLVNLVCGKAGFAQGLLIRGFDTTFGSGRVGKHFQIDRSLSGQNVFDSSELWLVDDGFDIAKYDVKKYTRVGIDYASEQDRARLWRWRIEL